MRTIARSRYILSCTVGYAFFSAMWIYFSDQMLATVFDPSEMLRLSTAKGLVFIAVTSVLLLMALKSLPTEAETPLPAEVAWRVAPYRLLLALALPLAAFALQWFFWSAFSPYVWFLFYPAVFLSSWVGGLSGGLLATVFSTVLVWYFFIPPAFSFALERPMSLFSIGLFMGMGLLFSFTHERLRRAEQRAAEAKFRSLVEQSLVGIYIVQDGRFRYANPGLARIFGYPSAADLVDRVAVVDLVASEHRQRVTDNMQRRISGEIEAMTYGFNGVRRDGTIIQLEVHGRSFDYQGQAAVIGVVLDVSERQRAEEALQRNEQLLRAVVDGSPDAIFVKDAAGRYLLFNEAAARIVGRPTAEVIGHDDAFIFPAEVAQQLKALDRGVMDANAVQNHQESVTTLGGETLTFLVTKGPLRASDGQVTGLFGISRDITERLRTETALRHREALLNRMGQLAKVGGWEFEVATGRGAWTDEVARIHDLGPEVAVSVERGLQFFTESSRPLIEQAVRAAIDHAVPYDLELEIVSAKGVAKWIRTVGEPVLENGRVTHVQGAFQDITARKLAELEVHRLNADLERRVEQRTAQLAAVNKELESFSYSVSHDLKAPLRGIDGYSRLLQQECQSGLNDECRGFVQNIRQGAEQMNRLIEDLLAYSRMERRPLQTRVVDLPGLVQAVVAERGDELQRLGAEVHLNAPAVKLNADRDGLAMVLRNLFENALKF
ncbi:MAG TPA: PAS domain S-box protein, partial [Rhodocyclaceae bacterium]|nr:PAS domain S-box protein [Rhodocyclaceae bacterium]